ncbi:hypothetical protein [Seonamhaeicola sp. ML3]|uniref:hypothetical protein n=1 Tax=Seonamhaeicola sp. ML3 TaxID=2937786 RepID=UPI00200FEE96|nr:hypothetical protein [Seonamhaeicola sp. ML3]
MKKQFLIGLSFLLFLCIACTKDIDFEQAKNIEISPTIESSIIFFEAQAPGFIENGVEVPVTGDFIEVDVFNSSFINDNLTKVDLVFETENSLPRDFHFDLNFVSESGDILDNFSFLTSESSTHTKTFEGDALDVLKNTSILAFTLTMLPGDAINISTTGSIGLKSRGVFYFNIES